MSEDKLVTYQAPGAVSTEVGGFGIEGLEGMGMRDIIVPRKVILQPTSKKEGAAGSFYDNLTQTATELIQAVVLNITHIRTLWGDDVAETTPACRSADGVTGNVYGVCADCDFNPDKNRKLWDKGERRCSLGYQLFCADRSDDSLFLFSAIKTSAKPVKVLISQLVRFRKPPFSYVTEFATKLEKNDQGKFYVFNPRLAVPLPPEDVAKYHDLYLSMKGVAIREVEDAAAEQAGGDGGSDDEIPF